jgi:hypothetical protein
MTRNHPLPAFPDLLRPLPNISRSIQRKEDPWRVRSGTQCIHRGEATFPEPVSPMLDLTVMTTLPAGLMVVDDQASMAVRSR